MAFVQSSPGGIADRLVRASAEMRNIETLLMSEPEVDQRILLDFREAVNHVRHAAWVTQQWLDRKAQNRDSYEILSLLTAERVRITTNLTKDLALDLDAAEITFETPGLRALYGNSEILYFRLRKLFKPGME